MLSYAKCPKCNGNVYVEEDYYGKSIVCLQCGYSRDIEADPTRLIVAKACSEVDNNIDSDAGILEETSADEELEELVKQVSKRCHNRHGG